MVAWEAVGVRGWLLGGGGKDEGVVAGEAVGVRAWSLGWWW